MMEPDWELSVIQNYVTAPCPHVVKILQDTGNDGELHPNSSHHPGSLVIEHQALARSECYPVSLRPARSCCCCKRNY